MNTLLDNSIHSHISRNERSQVVKFWYIQRQQHTAAHSSTRSAATAVTAVTQHSSSTQQHTAVTAVTAALFLIYESSSSSMYSRSRFLSVIAFNGGIRGAHYSLGWNTTV